MTVAEIVRPVPDSGQRHEKLRPWRSPPGQPPWARPALLLIGAVAATVYGWNIGRLQLHAFYAPAVKSMSESWKAFFYGGYDPAASITLDKLPGAFMVQALSARIFGFHAWSVVLPQVVAGVLAVLLIYRVVRRWQGPAAGLLAAAVLASMPILAALARSQISDGLLVILLVLAADAWQRAVATGRLRSLLLCGVWVGLAFQTKMVQAWGVLPAFAIAYLVASPLTADRRVPGPRTAVPDPRRARSDPRATATGKTPEDGRTPDEAGAVTTTAPGPGAQTGSDASAIRSTTLLQRLGHVALAGLVTVAVSLWQVGLFLVTPAGSRPFVDGSTNNSLFSMIFEYNLSTRFGVGGDVPGGFGGPGTASWWYMLSDPVAPQVGWVYPLAAAGLLLGLAGWRPVRRGGAGLADLARVGYLMWGLWILVHVIGFSAGRVAHSFYVAAVAPPVAALAAGGLVTLWRQYRRGGPQQWLLPAVLAASLGWTLYLCERFADFQPWLTPAVAVAGGAGILALVAAKLNARAARLALSGGVLALAGLLLAPAAWAGSTLDSRYAGSSIGPAAGPAEVGGGPGGGGQRPNIRGGPPNGARGAFPGGPAGNGREFYLAPGGPAGPGGQGGPSGPVNRTGGPGPFGASTQPSAETRALLAYLKAGQGAAKYLVAAPSTGIGGQLILAGASVLPMGGFSGQVPFPTANQLAKLVAEHKLRYVVVGGGRFGGGPGTGGGGPPGANGGPAGANGGPAGGNTAVQTWVTGHCTPVDAAAYGGTAGADSLYDCRPA